MTKQILKYNIPFSIIEKYLLKINITIKNQKYIIIDEHIYKKLLYNNLYVDLQNELENYYYNSKKFYITRKPSYNNFLTIIRHICNCNNLCYTSKILYDKSKYKIIYYILLKEN